MSDTDDLREAIELRREEFLAEKRADKFGYDGECREAVPFGELFSVFSGGKEYRTCTHTPPHTHPA